MSNPLNDPDLNALIHDTNSGLGKIVNSIILIEKFGPLNDKQKEYLDYMKEGKDNIQKAIDIYYIRLKSKSTL